jgi:hypothetical protein
MTHLRCFTMKPGSCVYPVAKQQRSLPLAHLLFRCCLHVSTLVWSACGPSAYTCCYATKRGIAGEENTASAANHPRINTVNGEATSLHRRLCASAGPRSKVDQ